MSSSYRFNLALEFLDISQRFAERPALDFGGGSVLTYAELDALANRAASCLARQGVRPHDVVAMTGEKHALSYAMMLACLKLGAPYTMLDPESPVERLRRILERCRPVLLLAEGTVRESLLPVVAEIGCNVLDKSEEILGRNLPAVGEDEVSRAGFTGETPAYIMFTSGSTGFPKGAVMTHQNVLSLIEWSRDEFGFGPGEVLTNVNPLYFDNSVFDFYSSLFTGATLAPFDKATMTHPRALLDEVAARHCTSWFSVPSMLIFLDTMKAFLPDAFPSMRRFIFGGEGYPKPRLRRLYDTYGHRVELVNVYGPTECTCICSSYRISDDDFRDMRGFPPLGRLIKNFGYLIVDDGGRPVSAGETGNLCLLGPHVGKGYYNDPDRTAEAFVQNPLNTNYEERMYRTGDLVHLEPEDGKLYIHGRSDYQVKHMGYRIELEEIENALCSIHGVKQAAAAHGTVRGLSRIVAGVSTDTVLEPIAVMSAARSVLPDYMVPSEIRILDALPRNANGKLDRRAVADLFFDQTQTGERGR